MDRMGHREATGGHWKAVGRSLEATRGHWKAVCMGHREAIGARMGHRELRMSQREAIGRQLEGLWKATGGHGKAIGRSTGGGETRRGRQDRNVVQ